MDDYKPSEPYVIKSGKRAGQTLELIMFQDYQFLSWFLNKMNTNSNGRRKNTIHKHLLWLIKKGENRCPTMICPHCKERTVTRFSLVKACHGSGISVDRFFCCCDNDECEVMIAANAAGHCFTLYPFRFSMLKGLRTKGEQKDLIALYKQAYCLPKTMRRETAFEFFNRL